MELWLLWLQRPGQWQQAPGAADQAALQLVPCILPHFPPGRRHFLALKSSLRLSKQRREPLLPKPSEAIRGPFHGLAGLSPWRLTRSSPLGRLQWPRRQVQQQLKQLLWQERQMLLLPIVPGNWR